MAGNEVIKMSEVIGRERCGFLLVSELQAFTKWYAQKEGKDVVVLWKTLCDWVEKYGGKPGHLEWRRTGAPMKCWHGVFMNDSRFMQRDLIEHVGQGCYKRLAKGGEYNEY